VSEHFLTAGIAADEWCNHSIVDPLSHERWIDAAGTKLRVHVQIHE
jgi:hypothetical protein